MNTSRALSVVIACAVLLGACGSDDDSGAESTVTGATPAVDATPPTDPVTSTGATSDVDPCSLLGGVDLDGLLGEPAGALSAEQDDVFGSACIVSAAAEDSRGSGRVVISSNRAADNYENLKEQLGVDAEVGGLGDAAFASPATVVVLAGDRLFFVQFVRDATVGDAASQEQLEAAARVVLDNLNEA